jgi:hypothetical protein
MGIPISNKRLIVFALIGDCILVGLFLLYWFYPRSDSTPIAALEDQDTIGFLAVGRQGYGSSLSRKVAEGMNAVAATRQSQFIVLGGDNFYPHGVSSIRDKQWNDKFEKLYNGEHLSDLPVYPVLGNHDYEGNVSAQIKYSRKRLGTGRWRMENRYYVMDFGRSKEGRVLVRIVFLDSIAMAEKPKPQESYLREAMDEPGEPVWKVIVGHYPLRSLTNRAFAKERILHDLNESAIQSGIDLSISSNDWIQQALDMDGEPLHVGTSGGADTGRFEEIPYRHEQDCYTNGQPGFAHIRLTDTLLSVTLFDADGTECYSVSRHRQ